MGALGLGLGGALRPTFVVCKHLLNGEGDLNDRLFRDQLKRLIVFIAEIYVAVLGLLLCDFVAIRF